MLINGAHVLLKYEELAGDVTAAPKNPQNDRLYVPAAVRKKDVAAKRLLPRRSMYSQSLMVSVGVSKMGCTGLIFVEPGVELNGAYYCNVLLLHHMLPGVRHIAGDFFIFQQECGTVRDREMIVNARLLLSSRRICGCRTAQTSIQLTTKCGA